MVVVGGWEEGSEVVGGWEVFCYQLYWFLFVTQVFLKVKKIDAINTCSKV